MAPMIDMVFLLLVFFMTVSNLAQAQKRIRLDLPESHQADIPEDLSDRTAVSIKEDGTVFWGANEISLDGLTERLEQIVAGEPELRVQVRADKATPFEHVRKVLRACATAGANDVIYATYEAGN